MSDVTELLACVRSGDAGAEERLATLLYDELRRLAAGALSRERPGRTLDATALVHEAWLRLGGAGGQDWAGRAHFLGAGAEAMRRILVERARRRARLRHGGAYRRTELDDALLVSLPPDLDLLALDEALGELQRVSERAARLVSLRFFGGLGQVEAATALGISKATADRDWAFARAFLYRAVSPPEPEDPTAEGASAQGPGAGPP